MTKTASARKGLVVFFEGGSTVKRQSWNDGV